MSPSTRKSLPTLSKAEEILRGLSGTWRVNLNVSDESEAKLRWLASRGRNFLAPGRDISTAVRRFVEAELSFEPSANARKLLDAAALGARSAIVLRFTAQQGVQLRPLTAAYLVRKIARGLDRRVGIATKALVEDIARSMPRIER